MEKVKDILLIALLATVIYYVFSGERRVESGEVEQRDTVVVTIYDTVRYIAPEPKSAKVVGVKISRMALSKRDSTEGRGLDSSAVECDSAEVIVPIEQKVYEDSAYRAYISGYMPNLDSLIITMPQQTVYIREKKRSWDVGLQIGYGINVASGVRFSPYIGIGVTYRLFSF